MLRESQKLTIEVAVRRARENGTETEEIHKLAAGMNLKEEAVRAYANEVLGPAGAGSQKADAPIPESQPEKTGKGREEWPEEQIQNLIKLHSQGMGPSAIAKAMGCEAKRIQSKLYNLKKSGRLAPSLPEERPYVSPVQPEPEEKAALQVNGMTVRSEAEVPVVLPEIIPDLLVEERTAPAPVRIASEIMKLARNFESSGAAIGRIQINEVSGWGCVSFDMPEGLYRVSIHRRKRK